MRLFKLLLFFLLIISGISCGKPSVATDNIYVAFKATLSGSGETPANTSKASGTATATYNKRTGILAVNVTYTGLTATAAHIHKGTVGVAGPTVFTFTTLASPINYKTAALDATQESDLLSNLYYINIHSAAFPNGEIRGQLIMQ